MNASRRPNLLALALRYRSFLLGGVLGGLVALLALVSLAWTPHSAYELNIANRLNPPSPTHWLGTDHFGRDIASMIMVGARNSLLVGFVAVGAGLTVGVFLGLWATARRGWVEELIMRFSDFAFAFPAILSAIMITAILGPGAVN